MFLVEPVSKVYQRRLPFIIILLPREYLIANSLKYGVLPSIDYRLSMIEREREKEREEQRGRNRL